MSRKYTFTPSFGRGEIVTAAVATARTPVTGNSRVLCLTNQSPVQIQIMLRNMVILLLTLDFDYS